MMGIEKEVTEVEIKEPGTKLEMIVLEVSKRCINDGIATLQHDSTHSGKCCYITIEFPAHLICKYRELKPLHNGLYQCNYVEQTVQQLSDKYKGDIK